MEFRKNTLKQDTLIFSIKNNAKSPMTIYNKMLRQFEYFQEKVGKAQRKEGSRRRKITLYSFRRTAFSIIDEQTNSEFAHWFLDHNHSVNYMDIMSVPNGQIGKFGYPFSQVDNTNLYKSFVNYN